MVGKVVAVCKSVHKGEQKVNIGKAQLIQNFGMDGDAHAGPWDNHIRLLAQESIHKAFKRGLKVGPGDFSEHITTRGIELTNLSVGTKLKIGEVVLEITQKGKVCPGRCNIFNLIGDCIMPKEGVYAKVLEGGMVTVGSEIKIMLDAKIGIIYAAKASRDENPISNILSVNLNRWGVKASQNIVKAKDRNSLKSSIEEMCEDGVDIILIVGGVGVSSEDFAPEVLIESIERELPGVANNVRENLLDEEDLIIFRGRAGIKDRTIIVNLPDNKRVLGEDLFELLIMLDKISLELTNTVECTN